MKISSTSKSIHAFCVPGARSRKSRPLSPDRSHVYRKLPDDIEDDLISDLSDFSDIDIDDLSDLDVDNENEDIGNKTSRRDSSRRTKSSIYKPGRHRKSECWKFH